MTLFNFETGLISLCLDSSFPHVHFFIIVFNKMYFNYLFLSKSFPQGLWVPEVRDFGLLIFPHQVTQKSEYSVEFDERWMSTVVIPHLYACLIHFLLLLCITSPCNSLPIQILSIFGNTASLMARAMLPHCLQLYLCARHNDLHETPI